MATELKKRPLPPTAMPVRRRKNRLLRRLLTLIIFIALVAGLIFFAVRYNHAQKEANRLADPKAAATEQTNRLVAEVGKLVDLPTNETPTIATVADITKLKGQAFYASAQNGDKVLIYVQAKKAFLYRPSTNKIIQIAPVNLGTSSQSSSSAQSQDQTATTPAP
jgi:cytoskeletal protein RodZ